MRKIAFTTLGWALIVFSVVNAAGAAERHHARKVMRQPTANTNIVNTNINARDSYAEFGPAYRGYDARAWGGAISAPAGR